MWRGGGAGGWRRRGVLLAGADVERLAELADALPERACEPGQALGTEHDERDDGDEEKVYRALDPHRARLANRRGARETPARGPAVDGRRDGRPRP